MTIVLIAALAGLTAALSVPGFIPARADASPINCEKYRVIDGDTFVCGTTRIRLAGIDAPEKPGHCRQGRDCAPGDPHASTANLARLMRWRRIECRPSDIDRYGRTIARCTAGDEDLSCAQIRGGFAIRRYGLIIC